MNSHEEQHEIALLSCIELVLMQRGNVKYNLIVAKLNSLYDITIRDCYKHPEYLRTVLKEVSKEDYNPIIDDIKMHLGDLAIEKDLVNFFKIMES